MLRSLWSRVSKSRKSFGDILGQSEVNGAVFVVPLQVDATEYFTIFVDGDIVMFLEGVDEMGGTGIANDLNAEIINNEVEDGWPCGVAKESWRVSSGVVAVMGKIFDQFDVGETSGLREAVHAGSNFH
jgi:hypothetical protein